MTRYAIDSERGMLLAVWPGGAGDRAATVAAVPKTADDAQALAVARTMTHLADAAWRTYTHPASAADSQEVNSEGWRRGLEREASEGCWMRCVLRIYPSTGCSCSPMSQLLSVRIESGVRCTPWATQS